MIVTYSIKNHKQANLIYQEDPSKLAPNRVMQFIRHHHEYQRPRLKMLDDYYKGANTGILDSANRRIDKGHADHRAVHSFGAYIADFHASFSVGKAITVKHDDDDRLNQLESDNDFDSINSDLFLDTSRFGRAYEYIYRGNDDNEHSVVLDPLETFVIYDLSVDPKPAMAVRYHQIQVVGDHNQQLLKYRIETWTDTAYTVYKPCYLEGKLVPEDREGNPETIYAFPVIEYKNNRFRLCDFERVIPLIDLYDAAESDTANYMTDLNDAMLVIKGDIDTLLQGSGVLQGTDPNDADANKQLAEDKLEILKDMKDANLLLLKSGVSMSGQQTTVDANYIHKEYDVAGTDSYKDRLAHDIHKFSHTPDLTDENFAGNTSGIAMKYKVLGTIELASTKRKQFEKGLRQRYRVIKTLEDRASGGMKVDPTTITFVFTDNMPEDDLSTINAVVSAGAQLPQDYLYQFLPNVTDPTTITDQLAQEQKDKTKAALKNFDAETDDQKDFEDVSDDGSTN